METQIIGILGAGVMGVGVTLRLIQAGYQVILLDISDDILHNAKQQIIHQFRLHNLFSQVKWSNDINELLERITFTTSYSPLQGTSLVIENVKEHWETKKSVHAQLDTVCLPRCIIGANTSAISITRIASIHTCPERVIGTHFMNPVTLKSMVEVIRGYHTSDAVIARVQTFLGSLGLESIVVNDLPGFVTNRVLMLTINEAIYVLQDQVASNRDIDRLFKGCFGHKMGPLETADLIGLDTILDSLIVLYESYNDSKYRPCPLLKKMVDAGLYGRKSGHGFYTYK